MSLMILTIFSERKLNLSQILILLISRSKARLVLINHCPIPDSYNSFYHRDLVKPLPRYKVYIFSHGITQRVWTGY